MTSFILATRDGVDRKGKLSERLLQEEARGWLYNHWIKSSGCWIVDCGSSFVFYVRGYPHDSKSFWFDVSHFFPKGWLRVCMGYNIVTGY